MEQKIVMMFHHDDLITDIEVPINITANEFINGMNTGFKLGINMDNPDECFLRAENPIALIKGEKTLEELGLRNGSSIFLGNIGGGE